MQALGSPFQTSTNREKKRSSFSFMSRSPRAHKKEIVNAAIPSESLQEKQREIE